MKSVILVLAFASASACALAAEAPGSSRAGPCAAPRIPAVSTSQAGADRVKKAVREWNACVAATPGTDPAVAAAVSEQARAWARATLDYSNGQRNSSVVAQTHERAKREHQRDIANAAQASAEGRKH